MTKQNKIYKLAQVLREYDDVELSNIYHRPDGIPTIDVYVTHIIDHTLNTDHVFSISCNDENFQKSHDLIWAEYDDIIREARILVMGRPDVDI